MPWANDGEVSPICGQDVPRSQAFGDGDNACVHKSQREIGVLVDHGGRANKIFRFCCLYRELTLGNSLHERQFCGGPNSRL